MKNPEYRSGLYLYQIETEKFRDVKKMMILNKGAIL